MKTFSTWKTVALGLNESPEAYANSIDAAGMDIGMWAAQILPKIACAQKGTEVELVCASVKNLGFKDFATFVEITERAEEFGLGLCPAEVGPALRLQFAEQKKGDWRVLAMDPVPDAGGNTKVFAVERYEDRFSLGTAAVNPEARFGHDCVWVFARSNS